MRNPIRLKNLSARYAPFYLVGIVILFLAPSRLSNLVWGTPLIMLGLALRGWAAGHLIKNDLLTVTGPYAHLRHPLYLGTILVATGFAILVGGLPGLALTVLIWPWFGLRYFPRKERVESDRLETRYGEVYRSYREAVPALWPPEYGGATPAFDELPVALRDEVGELRQRAAGRFALRIYRDHRRKTAGPS